MSKNAEMYEAIANKIIAMLDNGIIPWQKPWDAESEAPRNIVSRKAYRGINVWLLAFNSYSSPYWGTFNQISGKGGTIKRGEKATKIYYYSFVRKLALDEKGKPVLNEKGEKVYNQYPMLKEYNVFNLDQCTGLEIAKPEKVAKSENEKIEICENIWVNYANRPSLSHGGDRAFYRSSEDAIRMPEFNSFISGEAYYSTLFHEMGHSTGHASRLKRELGNMFGSEKYGREELIAEFSSAYLCAVAGIKKEIENSAAYIQSWCKAIKNDPAMIMICASKAQKASDHILGIKENEEEN